jgi:hypothetical protein
MGERENKVSSLHFSQRLIEVIARIILFALRAPDITLTDLVFEGLFMVHPPEAHFRRQVIKLLLQGLSLRVPSDNFGQSGFDVLIVRSLSSRARAGLHNRVPPTCLWTWKNATRLYGCQSSHSGARQLPRGRVQAGIR